jgi:hypothetical protein
MAVRAQELEVLQPVVVSVPVDVMELEGERRAMPLAQPAFLAPVSLEA